MSVFDVKLKSAKEPLEEKERMWVEVLEKVLADEEFRNKYSQKAKERAYDFRLEKIVEEWKEVIG